MAKNTSALHIEFEAKELGITIQSDLVKLIDISARYDFESFLAKTLAARRASLYEATALS